MKLSSPLTAILLVLSASTFSINAYADYGVESPHNVGLQIGGGGIEYKGKDTDGEGVGLSYLYYNYQFAPNYYFEVALVDAADITDWECKGKDGNNCFLDYDNYLPSIADNFEYNAVIFALKTDLFLSKRNRLYAKVGAAFYDYRMDLDHTRIANKSGTGLFIEAGWEYRWDNGFGLNASLQHQDAGDLEIDSFNIGISYSF
jgi:hypothetical protein